MTKPLINQVCVVVHVHVRTVYMHAYVYMHDSLFCDVGLLFCVVSVCNLQFARRGFWAR
jgi:hypothetical protein